MMRTNAKDLYHPAVSLLLFMGIMTFTMIMFHPVFLLISLVAATGFSVSVRGGKGARTAAILIPAVATMTTAVNLFFSHRGTTILFQVFGNPATLEALVFGLCSGMMISAVMLWCYSFSAMLTSDKIMAIFGHRVPAFAMIFSMVLNFIPRFRKRLWDVKLVQPAGAGDKHIKAEEAPVTGEEKSDIPGEGEKKREENHFLNPRTHKKRKIGGRIKNAGKVMSSMMGWALESSIDTASSMRARGYGLQRRSSYNPYRVHARDAAAIVVILFACAVTVASLIAGAEAFTIYPTLQMSKMGAMGFAGYAAFFVMVFIPAGINLFEEVRWRL